MQNGGGAKDSKVDSTEENVTAGNASSSGKIFIGGLSWETTTEKLTKHFKKYGEIIDSVIMRDRSTGNPRGFGFVTYSDSSVCDRVMEDNHVIDGRTVEVKKSVPRDSMAKGPKTKKIFVGGIPPSITEEEFKDYFAKFGTVVEHQIMQDHSTGRSRGFGFVTYDNEQVVDDIVVQGKTHKLGGKLVEIKKAEPKKPVQESAAALGPGRGGYGPGPVGYGDYRDGYGGLDGGPYEGSYRSGSGYGGGYGGSSLGGYGGYAGSSLGGYGGYGGSLGSYGGISSGYTGSMLGGYGEREGYGGMGYGGYGVGGYGGGYGSSMPYGGSRFGGSGTGRYHPYGRN
eukprot:c23431_g3_i1 orf=270-1289(+)